MERRLKHERTLGALTYWKALQARSYAYPYFHPPDLFSVDPCVVKPYYVPRTFIPTYVGGNIEIQDVSGGRVKSEGSETKEFIIDTIEPSQEKTVRISGFTAYPGRKCELEINAGPVPDEAFLGNNKATFKFIMEN